MPKVAASIIPGIIISGCTISRFALAHVVVTWPGACRHFAWDIAGNPIGLRLLPISHSLLMVLAWSLIFGGGYYLIARNRGAAVVLGLLVLSHWILDLIVHIPDLPLYPGNSPKFGLGLWNSMTLTVLAEGAIFIAGIVMYMNAKKQLHQKVTWKFWSLIAFLIIIQVSNLFGPPPPSVAMIAWAGHLQWIFVLWAWWADR